MDNRGFLLLTGDVGTGKTTLIHALLKSLSQEVVAATVPDPGLSPLDFFNYIARGFHFGTRFASKGEFLDHFIDFLDRSHAAHKKVLLIIDESQRLTSALLEEIRLLSNIEKYENKLLNIFFVGQNEFNQFLMLPEHKAIRQRITINYHINPLDENETGAYIRHRLKVAGARMEIFDEGSIAEVFRFSKGYPRLINIICDHAMLTGFIKSAEVVTAGMVSDCAADLTLPQRELLQAEVEKTERPAAPLPAAMRESGPPQKSPPQNRWQRPALLVALLAALLLSALALYPQGFERFKALWRTQFQGMTAGTTAPPPTKVAPQPPAPAGPPDPPPPPVSPAKPPPTPVSKIQEQPAAKAAPPGSAALQAPETAPPDASVATAPEPPSETSAGTPAPDAEDPKPPPAPATSQPPTAAPEDAPGAQDPGRKDASQRLPIRSATETPPQDDAGSGSDPGGIIDWMLEKNKRRQ
jgi:type II secretory pathway predicted ATPase ExeA